MSGIKDVIDYSKLDYHKVIKLPLDVFMMMRKNKVIDNCMKTEEGRKYLADCKRLNTTEPDYNAIRKFQNRHKQ
jgi:hypothetical protein